MKKLPGTVDVCSHCKRASCWQGFLLCDEHKDAGVISLSVERLREWKLEDESYWLDDLR